MKRGLKQRQKTKPITLTLSIASEIVKVIANGQPITSNSNKFLNISGYQISKNTYWSWLRNGIVPVDAPKGFSLSQMVAKAGTQGQLKQMKKVLKTKSVKQISGLLNIDLSVTEKSVRRYRNGKMTIETELYKSVSPELVRLKQKAAIFILSALDPSYKN